MLLPRARLIGVSKIISLALGGLAALLLASCDRSDTAASGRATGPEPTAADVAAASTGLDFPSNGGGDVRFKFSGANLVPMYPATYVWRINVRQQAGYYATFFWGPDGAFTGANYYGAEPNPQTEPKTSSTTHRWAISLDGSDAVTDANGNSTLLGYGTWKTQALRVYNNGSRKVHEFYWDLPDTTKVIRFLAWPTYGKNPPAASSLTFGTSPWAPGSQNLSGILRGIQIYANNLPTASILSEINSPLSTSAGSSSIWYLNLNPTPSDISDKSGKGHHPAWVGSGRPALWTESATTPPPPPPAPTVSLTANPASVASGSAATLTWSSTNATSCAASGAWSGTQALSGSQSTGALSATSTYTLTCTGDGGTATQSATVTVTPPPAPTVSLFANPDTVRSGQTSTLTWSSTNATSCTASGAWTGSMALSGSQSTGALSATSTYTLTCTGDGGTASHSATVTVLAANPAPTVSLSANPTSVTAGSASTLTWYSANATSCAASGAWSGSKALSGSQSTGALSATSTYTLTCTGAGGTASQSATVTVTAPTPAPTVSLTANPTSITAGSASTLTWSSTNATSCAASGAWSGSQALSGSQSTGALSTTSTYTLSCTGAGGTASQSATVTVTASSGGQTGLNFPSNTSEDDVRFRFRDAALQPMYPATYVWRVNLRQQAGYYTTFFWGPDGAFTGAGYYGAHPYPDGDPKPSSTSHHWEVSADGNDFIDDANGNNTAVAYDSWHLQAFRAYDNGTNKVQEFFWDLPDTTKVIRVLLWESYGPPSNPALTFGTAPWAPATEHLSGILRGLQLYASALSGADIVAEANAPLSTNSGKAGIWYLNLNPTPSDISDKSGKGHQPEWVTPLRPGLWTGP